LDALITVLENKMERPLFVWLKSSLAASKYVTSTHFATGIGVGYDPGSRHVILSTEDSGYD
jgi:hypothetical protein